MEDRELLARRLIDDASFDCRIVPSLLNSLWAAAVSTVLGLLLTVPACYAFAKLRFRRRERLCCDGSSRAWWCRGRSRCCPCS